MSYSSKIYLRTDKFFVLKFTGCHLNYLLFRVLKPIDSIRHLLKESYGSGFHISCCFSSILELSVRGESNEFHIFIFFQQHNISLTVNVHPA